MIPGRRLRDHAVTLLGLLVMAALVWLASPPEGPASQAAGGLASSVTPVSPVLLDLSADPLPLPAPPARRIADLRPGMRVLAINPDRDGIRQVNTPSAVDPPRYRLVSLRIEQPLDDGSRDTIRIQTLQPTSWLARHGVQVGRTAPAPLDLEELGVAGQAVVDAIEPCPPIEPGSGAVVLTTVNHLSDAVYQLTVADPAGRTETLTPTENQPFYCLDESDWLHTYELLRGDRLRTHDGQVTVTAVQPLPGRHRVYNLTVETEHAYHVSALGVVSHNTSCERLLGQLSLDEHLTGSTPQHFRQRIGDGRMNGWKSQRWIDSLMHGGVLLCVKGRACDNTPKVRRLFHSVIHRFRL